MITTKQTTVSETQALGILGHMGRMYKEELRRLVPHTTIERGRSTPTRLYLLEDVLALRRARSAAWQAEVKALRLLTDQRRAERESNDSTPGGTSKV